MATQESAQIRDATLEDCDQLGLITVSASLSAFIGAIPEEHLDLNWKPESSADGWRRSFAENTNRGQLFRVIEAGERLIGFAWSAPWAETEDYDASIRGLYVHPSYQGCGFGRLLIQDSASILLNHGARSLEIGCVRENPNCEFYRHLGGIEIGSRPARVDSFDTQEILFGWPDLPVLT